MTRLILASQSPRRIELLRLITPHFSVVPSHFDEDAVHKEDPVSLVLALAQGKAQAVPAASEDAVLGCDTVVFRDGEILGKPKDSADARRMMRLLSGGVHSVVTGVCILHRGEETCFSCETTVRFYPLSEEEIEAYIKTDEPYDKAGGYGIQARGGLFVEEIQGDYNNVVGMPLSKLYRALCGLGILQALSE